MRRVTQTARFARDLKRAAKRGQDIDKLEEIVDRLQAGQPLDPRHRDHSLTGVYSGHRECHIEPDWLLIYRITDDELMLVRTGTHSDLFR